MAKAPCVKALILITEGTEEIEFAVTVDVLRRAGISLCIAGLDGSDCVKCSRDLKICPDMALSDAKDIEYDMIILPGGPGTPNFAKSQEVKALLQKQEKADKWIAAICAAPTVLKAAGIGKGKTITAYPMVKDQLTADYKFVEDDVVIDGKLITSRGPGTTFDFALKITELLVGKAMRDEVAKATLYKGNN